MRPLWTALRLTLVLTALVGIGYPMAVLGLGQLLFPRQANGSLVVRSGRVIGSTLIGQRFVDPRYLHGRPSAAGGGYDAANSGGSNLGPSSKKLIEAARRRLAAVLRENPGVTAAQVPVDAITASGSGLDPEISPAYAELQAPRIARVRGVSKAAVRGIIRRFTRPRWMGIFGEPGVNVLEVNLALDHLHAGPNRSP